MRGDCAARVDAKAGTPLYRFRFGTSEFDESRFELTVGGLTTDIEQKPLQVLAALLRRPGEIARAISPTRQRL